MYAVSSNSCMICEDFRLWVDPLVAMCVFNINTGQSLTKIDGLPDLLQVCDDWNVYIDSVGYDLWLITLTVTGQLMIINREYPRGRFIKVQAMESIKYINQSHHNERRRFLIMIDHEGTLCRHSLDNPARIISNPDYVIEPELLDTGIISLSIDRKFLTWLDRDGIITMYDNLNKIEVKTDCQSIRLIGRFVVDDESKIYLIDNFQLIEQFQVDYPILDIAYYPDNYISIINDDGQVHQYQYNGQLERIDYRYGKRFINIRHIRSYLELDTGEILNDISNSINYPFKLLNLKEYYQPRIRSAGMNLIEI